VRRNLYCPATRKALFDIGPLCRGARRTRPRPTTSATNSSAAASSVADRRRRGGGDRRVMWPTVPGTLRYPLVVPPSPSASSTLRSAARPRTGPPLHRGHHHRPVKRQPNDRPGPRLPREGLAPLLCPAICGVGKRPDHGPRPHRACPGVAPGDGSHPHEPVLGLRDRGGQPGVADAFGQHQATSDGRSRPLPTGPPAPAPNPGDLVGTSTNVPASSARVSRKATSARYGPSGSRCIALFEGRCARDTKRRVTPPWRDDGSSKGEEVPTSKVKTSRVEVSGQHTNRRLLIEGAALRP